jgi:hypothetical protein
VLGKVRNRVLRAAHHRWRMAPGISDDRAIVIGGSPRSGTTLVRRLLDASPSIMCGPETGLLLPGPVEPERLALDYGLDADAIREWRRASPSQVAFVETFMRAATARAGKQRWGDKTPLNVSHLDWILGRFPRARFVHVIRDGRDAVCSMRMHPTRRLVAGRFVWVPQERTIEDCVRSWRRLVEAGLRRRGDPRYHEVRYEELVWSPSGVMAALFSYLGEEPLQSVERVSVGGPATEAADQPISSESVGRWTRDLSADERVTVKRVAGDLLVRLGYAEDDRW